MEIEEETPKRVNFRTPIDVMKMFRRRTSPPTLPEETNQIKNYPMFDQFKKEQESSVSDVDRKSEVGSLPSLEGKRFRNYVIKLLFSQYLGSHQSMSPASNIFDLEKGINSSDALTLTPENQTANQPGNILLFKSYACDANNDPNN